MRTLRLSLLIASAVAALIFAAGLAVSVLRPITVESFLRESIRREIERRVGKRVEALSGGALSRLASRVSEANGDRIAQLRKELPARVSAIVGEMQNADCECRKFVAAAARAISTSEMIVRLGIKDQLNRLIRAKYAEVSQSLLREFRIFTAANALVFLLLFLTTCFRKRAGLQLLLPAIVLFGAAIFVASLYFFGQNWLHTILFSDYVGFGYFAYLGAAVALLSDVTFNRARISTRVVNAIFDLVGATISAAPC